MWGGGILGRGNPWGGGTRKGRRQTLRALAPCGYSPPALDSKTSAPLTRLACAEADLYSTSHFGNSSGLTGCHKWHSLLRTARPLGRVKWAAVPQGKEGCTASSAVRGKPVVRCAGGFWCLKFATRVVYLGISIMSGNHLVMFSLCVGEYVY